MAGRRTLRRVRATRMPIPVAIRTASSVTAAVKSVAGAASVMIFPEMARPA